MGLSDYEATTLSVSLTTSLVNEVVAKEGDLSDDDEVYKVRCCEERYFPYVTETAANSFPFLTS